ncbi:MAG: DUF547 domain-containing protein [Acidobacteria bacterium]|nr:DUF547 domain-containing protein [Acidobacteriota bacterium]MYD72426.1 DUF547 domain-containing protein [Acidobacteriota bacterium]MYJ04624.1 DUF547 domain-containing protein [Acidobacteriota bacterium]
MMKTVWRKDVAKKRRGRRLAGALIGAGLFAAACGAPVPEEIEGWDVSDEASVEQLDHGPWQEILDGYVATDGEGVNLFDYEGLQANAGDAAKLNAYLEYLQNLDPRDYSRAEQMAYWINFYNALTVKVVLDEYPVETIRDIHEGVVPYTGPWDDVHARVTGEDLTLNHMEHGILRPLWQEERIHYAVNCAAYGCPHLIDTAFTAANTEELLDAGARAYVNNFRGVDVVDEDFIVISSIYDWYAEDFGDTEESIMEHLRQHAEDELATFLEGFEGAIEYDYDWGLNAQNR